jgi:hypothetical protein
MSGRRKAGAAGKSQAKDGMGTEVSPSLLFPSSVSVRLERRMGQAGSSKAS